MNPQKPSLYTAELERRISAAAQRDHDLHLKYWIHAQKTNRSTSLPAFDNWQEEKVLSNGQTDWISEYPSPYSFLYNSFFLRVLYWAAPILLIPELEKSLSGDIIDFDYLEGLLTEYEELGAATPGNVIIAPDTRQPRAIKNGMTVEQLSSSGAALHINHQAYIECGAKLANRIAMVRGWIERSKAQTPSPAAEASASESKPAEAFEPPTIEGQPDDAPVIDFAFDRLLAEEVAKLCVAIGLDDEAQSNKTKPGRAWGMAEVLVYHRFVAKGETANLAQAVGRAYGFAMAKNYAPDELSHTRKNARIRVNKLLFETLRKIELGQYQDFEKIQNKPRVTRQ